MTTALQRDWLAWVDIRGTDWARNYPDGNFTGTQINMLSGLTYRGLPGWIVGVVAGYESFGYDARVYNGRLSGDGVTVGAYSAWLLSNVWKADSSLAYSMLNYNLNAGTAFGSFDADRIMARSGLTGRYAFYDFAFEPSMRVYALFENQNAWTDSLGALHDKRSFIAGRASWGANLLYPIELKHKMTLSPYIGLYGDYYFSTNDAVPAGEPVFGIRDGWSTRVTPGLILQFPDGTLSGAAEIGGIGASDYTMVTWRVRGALKF